MRWLASIILLTSSVCLAQETGLALPSETATQILSASWYPVWLNTKGSFLEPNRFAVVYDRTPRRLRLEVGYGGEVLRVKETTFGGEALIWSGLKTLTGFRFPVETADYFFGLYSVFPIRIPGVYDPVKGRVRVSHISSHLVDGTQDTVIGGSSSKYSREFVSLEFMRDLFATEGYCFSIGLKYVFHQVTKNEPALQILITAQYAFARFSQRHALYGFLSTAAGPSLPVYAVGLAYQERITPSNAFDVYGEYHVGQSRYGVDGNRKESGFELGIRLYKQ